MAYQNALQLGRPPAHVKNSQLEAISHTRPTALQPPGYDCVTVFHNVGTKRAAHLELPVPFAKLINECFIQSTFPDLLKCA